MAVVPMRFYEVSSFEADWRNWFEEGARLLKQVVKDFASIFEAGGTLEDLSNALWRRAPEILAPVLEAALQEKANAMRGPSPCPNCGHLCKTSRKFPRKMETRSGTISIARHHYACPQCKTGFFPFDEALGLTGDRKQSDLQRAALELFTEVPYETASELFTTLTGLSFSDHAMHDLACELGQTLELKDVVPSQEEIQNIIDADTKPGHWRPVLVVSADGAHVPTRPESLSRSEKRGAGEWREAKGVRVFLARNDDILHILSWHQIANEEQFGEDLRRIGALIPQDEVRIALIGDGAPWIWKHMKEVFPDGQEILDYYHCKEHLHKVANLLHNAPDRRQAWVESVMSRLFFGEVDSVVWGLERTKVSNEETKKEVEKLITYLKNNQHRIDYHKARKRQFPIGSGGIESANKAVSHMRLKRSGAWWQVENANTMLALRCAKFNNTIDVLYKIFMTKRREKRQQKPARQ